jgi:TRAP-type C4-dicarboxylate transport system substrate-binding protein
VYSRADLSRTVALVVALSLTAVSTSASAREFRAADTQNENYPTVQALSYIGRLIAENSGGRHEPYGFVGLAFYDSGARSIYNRVRPVQSLSAEDRTIFREAAIRSSQFRREKWNDLEERSRLKAKDAGVTIMTDFDRKPFEAAMERIYAKAQRDPAAAEPIQRIRKVE